MRAYLPDYEVIRPSTVEEALEVLANRPGTRPLAGGTDLMVVLGTGDLKPGTYLDLHAIRDFKGPAKVDGGLHLRPLTTYSNIRKDVAAGRQYPLLPIAAREVGVLGIQSRGTWAGNIANASPAADGVPALMAYDAMLELSSRGGKRSVALCDFYTDYKKMDLKDGELITDVALPAAPAGRYEYYRKVGTRRFQAISKVVLTGWITIEGGVVKDVRLVCGSVAPHTLRARKAEAELRGKPLEDAVFDAARQALGSEIRPIDDVRSTRDYRREVAGNLLLDFLKQVQAAERS